MSLIERIEEIEASVTGPMTRDDMMRAFEHVPRLCAAVRELEKAIARMRPLLANWDPEDPDVEPILDAITRAEAALEGEE